MSLNLIFWCDAIIQNKDRCGPDLVSSWHCSLTSGMASVDQCGSDGTVSGWHSLHYVCQVFALSGTELGQTKFAMWGN